MYFRIIAAILFICSGSLAGLQRSFELKNIVIRSRQICRLISRISEMIRYSGADVYEIINSCSDNESFSELTFISKLPDRYVLGCDFHILWRSAVSGQAELTTEEVNLLDSVGDLLGTTDIEGQIKGFALLEKEADELYSAVTENYRQKGRFYRSLGALIGVFIGIIIV